MIAAVRDVGSVMPSFRRTSTGAIEQNTYGISVESVESKIAKLKIEISPRVPE
jgi:hypothetical protein